MRDSSTIMRGIQRVIREQLDERGIALKVVSAGSGIPYATLCSYFPGNERGSAEKQPAQLPGGAIYALCGAIPNDLLNLLFPDGWALVQVPTDADYDKVSACCRNFIDTKDQAHHPDSELGRDIGPGEQARLDEKIVELRA
jgi:hypothetical protein